MIENPSSATEFSDTQPMQESPTPAEAENLGTGALTAGEMLRRARESKGMHLELLSATLKVPAKKIEALESSRLDDLPDMAFARALSASICRQLQMDPAPVLALLPQNAAQAHMAHGSDRRRGAGALDMPLPPPKRSIPASSKKGLLLLLLLSPLALVAFLFLQQAPGGKAQPTQAVDAFHAVGTDAQAQSEGVGLAVSVEPLTTAPELGEQKQGVDLDESQTLSAVPVTESQGGQGKYIVQQLPEEAPLFATAAASQAQSVELSIEAKADSWAQVKDAAGQVLLNRLVRQGERLTFRGPAPYSVNLGRNEALILQQNGQTVSSLEGKIGGVRAELPLP